MLIVSKRDRAYGNIFWPFADVMKTLLLGIWLTGWCNAEVQRINAGQN